MDSPTPIHWKEAAAAKHATDVAVIGSDTDVELLPAVFNAAMRAGGLAGRSVRLECAEKEFEECITGLRTLGFRFASVGNPHKVSAARIAKEFFVVRHALGVANALLLDDNVYAQNTEVPAFAKIVSDLPVGTALVMGSGRAARSAVMPLLESGWRVRLWNRNLRRSKPFVTLFERFGKVETVPEADPTGCNLIVNATALGKKAGEAPPVVWNHAKPRSMAIDFVYRNVHTEFLRSASRLGFRTVDGRQLVVEQAAFAFQWWLDRPAPRDAMLEATGVHVTRISNT